MSLQKKNYDSAFCGSLPLQHLNVIQPHGMLLVLDREAGLIIQASENVRDCLGIAAPDIINTPLAGYLDEAGWQVLHERLKGKSAAQIPLKLRLQYRDRSLETLCMPRAHTDYLILEILPLRYPDTATGKQDFVDVFQQVKRIQTALDAAGDEDELCRIATRELRAFSGFDKVHVYRFDDDWNGKVVAEEKADEMEAYLGLTFPASDIPKQARQLYLKNPYRVIPNGGYEPVNMFPVVNPVTDTFVDLSGCEIRGVATVHLEYMKNMQIKASMSVRILLPEGRLWGLISFHHRTPKYPDYETCSVFELVSSAMSAKLASLVQKEQQLHYSRLQTLQTALIKQLMSEKRVVDELLQQQTELLALVNASGVAISYNQSIHAAGMVPSTDDVRELIHWLNGKELHEVYAVESLSTVYKPANRYADTGSGILAIPVQPARKEWIIFFRPEWVHEIEWGGNPNEAIRFEKDNVHYHPRNSFEVWQQVIFATSLPWQPYEIRVAAQFRYLLLDLMVQSSAIGSPAAQSAHIQGLAAGQVAAHADKAAAISLREQESRKQQETPGEDDVREKIKELSDKDERFRMVAKATNDTFWDWNLADSSMWWSDNFTLVFGYEATADTRHRTFWIEHVHPDDRERVKESIFGAINKYNEQWSAEYRFEKAGGSYAEILDRGYILKNEQGTPYRMLGSMLDVTSLKRAEAEISNSVSQKDFLAQAMPLSVWTASPDGKITFLNQQFARYTGIEVGELMHVDWKTIVHPDDLVQLTASWQTALINQTDFAVEVRVKRKDDAYRWQLVRAKARIETDNQLAFWVGTNTDIHAQKMATETMEQQVKERTQALQFTNRQLEESNHELQQYAYIASHDLKEPVRKINMFGNILKTKYLQNHDEKINDYMDRIINSSTRMMRLIDDLLNFSNLSLSVLFEPIDLNKTLQDILSDLELSIQEKNAQVQVDELPVINAVPAQMRQVFQNLISNALKFSKPDLQPQIRVWAEFSEELLLDSPPVASGPYCRIFVQDNGIGFNEIYLNKIFTLFQRLHSREFEGTGIGLAVVQKIIIKHNGLISARSRENEGATFIVVLPVKQE